MVSSPGASEGKTTVACTLAMAYAEALRTVLIVDCDMRRPRVHRIFGVPNEGGLARLLSERLSPDDDVFDSRSLFLELQRTGRAGVSVLTSGEAPDGTSNLLHSRRFCQLIEQARRQFDVVLLDTPPMLQFADARIVASVADGALLVVRSGQTLRDAALAARKQLDEDGIPLVGVVLNDWDPKAIGYYGYEYYENSYYAETARADLP
jgi:capsular exopolysaccharide synthesis family protein